MKMCNSCGQTKPFEAFYRRPSGSYRTPCRQCVSWKSVAYTQRPERSEANKAIKSRYRARHPDAERARCRAWNQRNRAHIAERAKAWAIRNPGRKRDILKEWRADNASRAKVLNARANALRRAREASVEREPVDRLTVFERDQWICHICRVPVLLGEASLDHVVPISKGGGHTYGNCRTAHLKCNLKKGAKSAAQETAA